MTDHALLTAVLDRLLPSNGELPGAGSLGLGPLLADDPLLETMPDAIDRVLGGLPGGFAGLATTDQVAALKAVETAEADAFALLINLVYNAYYIDQRVLAQIESTTGYKARAPQPHGYEIEPFDESILSTIREREPFWRKAD